MSFLGKGRKQDLLLICEELGEHVDHLSKVPEIKKVILGSESYDETEVKVILDRIVEERLREEENEKQEAQEKRKLELEKGKLELEREESLRQHELELKKLEVSQAQPQVRTSHVSENSAHKIQLTQIMPKFEEKRDEMGLYLINFERKAEMAQVPKKDWTAYLLSALPAEVSNMLAREAPENANDYDYVKILLMKRYKMNSEKLKQCFYRHQKSPEKNWRNYYHELRSYFTEWIEEMKVETFVQLRDLIVAEQIKFRVPVEIREHFLDNWMNIKDPEDLAQKLDDYESVRDSFKRKERPPRNNFRLQEGDKFNDKDKFIPFKDKFNGKRNVPIKEDTQDEGERDKRFERRKQPKCYECGSPSHLKPQCDKLRRCYECGSTSHLRSQCEKLKERVETLNMIREEDCHDVLAPYVSQGKINGIQMTILRDSGASIDLICRKYIKPSMLTTETVWIRTPLEESPICLPLAEVEIDCTYGHIVTKAAVIRDSLDQGRYLLGNRTAELLTEAKQNVHFGMHTINAIQTRSKTKVLESDLSITGSDTSDSEEDHNFASGTVDDNILPMADLSFSELELMKLSPKEFLDAQMQSEELKLLFKEAKQVTDTEKNKYLIKNQKLFFVKIDKRGTERHLLVVPKKFRNQMMTFCHE